MLEQCTVCGFVHGEHPCPAKPIPFVVQEAEPKPEAEAEAEVEEEKSAEDYAREILAEESDANPGTCPYCGQPLPNHTELVQP